MKSLIRKTKKNEKKCRQGIDKPVNVVYNRPHRGSCVLGKVITDEFAMAVLRLMKDMQKQLGADNPVARYVTSAILAKLTRDKLKDFIKEEDNGEKRKMIK